MQKYLFKNISVVNEGEIKVTDVLVEGDRIERIDNNISVKGSVIEIDGQDKYLLVIVRLPTTFLRNDGN